MVGSKDCLSSSECTFNHPCLCSAGNRLLMKQGDLVCIICPGLTISVTCNFFMFEACFQFCLAVCVLDHMLPISYLNTKSSPPLSSYTLPAFPWSPHCHCTNSFHWVHPHHMTSRAPIGWLYFSSDFWKFSLLFQSSVAWKVSSSLAPMFVINMLIQPVCPKSVTYLVFIFMVLPGRITLSSRTFPRLDWP